MPDSLQLAAFALPPAFPPELVPEARARFVRDCVPGLSRTQLLARTRPAAGHRHGSPWPT
jgi:hypothetical protein